jgi:glycosyltransferase involved in cell wall biosynthesis
MKRYTQMLATSMSERGHFVEILKPVPFFFKIKLTRKIRKWLGYIDQYIMFPIQARQRIRGLPPGTLLVFIDHALGPWVHLARNRPHIIHCHDFLAQESALGKFPENPTGLTGRIYQAFIRRGYKKGQNFISISLKTQGDLHKSLGRIPAISEVVYNGLNQHFTITNLDTSRSLLGQKIGFNLSYGYLLHVGGNQWYKNRLGVIKIYNALQDQDHLKLSLLMIGAKPSAELLQAKELSPFKEQIHFFVNVDDDFLSLAYSGACALLFPSIGEGFGWPIAEAMASGCPVITTNEAPMTEVGGSGAFYIPRKPNGNNSLVNDWAIEAAGIVRKVVGFSAQERLLVVKNGLKISMRFESKEAIDKIENIYNVIAKHKTVG